jgi:hypothetical protein
MALRGNLSSREGGVLSGSLEVGIPESILGLSKNKRIDAMFSPAQGGYRWVDLKIGGTGAVPQDDFKQLYNTTVPVEADGEASEALDENAVDTFDS